MARATVSVIIVNWNAKRELLECLESLNQHPPPEPWEVTVVDNGSRDGSVDAVKLEAPWVRVIANPDNRGLPAANNQGIVASSGDALLICNPDVVFTAGAISALVDLLDRRSGAGIVVPRLLYHDGALQTSAGDLPTLSGALLGRQLQRRRARGAKTGMWWDGWNHATEEVIGRGHEAAYLVRRSAVVEVGLQDERFRLDWEGIDWMDRFRAAGWQVWLCPDAAIIHLGGASIRQVPLRWVVLSHLGLYRYFAKRTPKYVHPMLGATVASRAVVKMAVTAAGVAMYERAHRGRSSCGARGRRPGFSDES
jgi:GT2 family glycosyltransferase